ncbi:ankyrin repeat domain-containing protein 30A, putative [Pediculus humanus corporis]|uniref:Ankyrin repeat domain-containing protein 30A, putative n=1 Tax=Pediculus humanus subsp. corporis TaxID=121224 RepID=E0VU64_PEDHC|nr:ankyrin repeat domain-containing protein 30A, putative [Pediculus humanus corporis]EEB16920.1 ankyrin repeat domain-containing protein 30A, putative [Pediculus humanus corporis]
MNDQQFLKVLPFLDNKCCQIGTETDVFMHSTFLLPKTPSQKRTRQNKRTKNLSTAFNSKQSIANSTMCLDNSNLNSTISTRTRAARRGLTSKISSQLNVTCEKQVLGVEEIKKEVIIESTVNKTITVNETFVVQNTSTCTKTIIKKKKNKKKASVLDETLQEQPKRKNTEGSLENDKSPFESQKLKRSKTMSETTPLRKSKSIFSRTLSEGPIEQNTFQVMVTSPKEQNNSNVAVVEVKRKSSRTLSESPNLRPRKMSKTSNEENGFGKANSSEIIDQKSNGTHYEIKTPSLSPIENSKILPFETPYRSPTLRSSSRKCNRSLSESPMELKKERQSLRNRKQTNVDENNTINNVNIMTVTKHYDGDDGDDDDVTNSTRKNEINLSEDKKMKENFKYNQTITLPLKGKKTRSFGNSKLNDDLSEIGHTKLVETSLDDNDGDSFEKSLDEVLILPKKKKMKRKIKKSHSKNGSLKENEESVRITRTKSKAMKESLNNNSSYENKQNKILNKAKMTSLKKEQLTALLESNKLSGIKGENLTNGGYMTPSAKYQLLSCSKMKKTPLATLPNSTIKKPKTSGYKDRLKTKVMRRDSSVENTLPHKAVKVPESETKLLSKKKKEDEAAKKREKVIKKKQEELRKKNELKHQLAMKQREKLEQEKYNNIIQSEKEKEERHKLILQERQMKLKEEVYKKKMLAQQKAAEIIERRRHEEEARIAKLKEIEAEEQRIALEKQKEQERLEKRAQERLALKKAREEYELQMKQELETEKLKFEKLGSGSSSNNNNKFLMSGSKMASASKKQRFGLLNEKKEWDYKPRNENDYGLEDENSEFESDDEKPRPCKPCPSWCDGLAPIRKIITLDMLNEYMPCYQKSPDIQKMFNLTPTRRIKRTSSAIWNTPTS